MKTAHRLWISLLLGMQISPLCAQAPLRRHFSFAVHGGSFFANEKLLHQLYGSPIWPLGIELNYQLSRAWSLFFGGRLVSAKGVTMVQGAVFQPESYPIRLQLHTLRLGVEYHFPLKRISPGIGAGFSFNHFQERWLETSILNKGNVSGIMALTDLVYNLSVRWAVQMQLEYSFIPIDQGVPPARGTDMGGFYLGFGVLLRL